jgi:Fic family protein
LAIDRQIERHKEEYYFVLHRCSDGKYFPDPKRYRLNLFLTFMMKVLSESLNDIGIYRNRYRTFRELSPSEDRVLKCFQEQPEIRLQTKRVCESTLLPRRTAVAALSKLVEKGLLQSQGRGAGVRYQLVF